MGAKNTSENAERFAKCCEPSPRAAHGGQSMGKPSGGGRKKSAGKKPSARRKQAGISAPRARRIYLIAEAGLLMEYGFAPVRCPPLTTVPIPSDPRNKRLRNGNPKTSFSASDNIGLLLGQPSNGLVVVDFTSPEAMTAADHLPVQLRPIMITGRESAPFSNYWFLVDTPPDTPVQSYLDPTRSERPDILELRSTGAVTLVPPSVYPPVQGLGEGCVAPMPLLRRIGTEKWPDLNRVAITELQTALGDLAAAVLLARFWPRLRSENHPNEAIYSLMRLLVWAGWDAARFGRFGSTLMTLTGEALGVPSKSAIRQHSYPSKPPDQTAEWNTFAQYFGPQGNTICASLRDWISPTR